MTKPPGQLGGFSLRKRASASGEQKHLGFADLNRLCSAIWWNQICSKQFTTMVKYPSLNKPAGGKMKTDILKSMSISELWSLHELVNSLLASKIAAEKARLEAKLRLLNGAVISIETVRRPYPPVRPKRNPVEPSQTWAGRGRRPRWLSAYLRDGKKVDDFRIAS